MVSRADARTRRTPRTPRLAVSVPAALLGTALAVLAATPVTAAAQPVVVGAVAGASRSRQLLARASDSESRSGFVAGAWMDIVTPKPLLHVLAEVAYARRGGRFPLGGPSGLTGEVESDWLTFTVAPSLFVAVGPVGAYAYAGPTLEMPMRTRSAAALRNAFATPSDQGLAVTAGGGLEGRAGRWVLRAEARVLQGLSSAYSGSAGDILHRSTELLLRLGKDRRTEGGAGG